MRNQNIFHVGYCGGSGGFLLLHMLLLSNQYFTCFENNKSFEEVFQEQWNINDLTKWKTTEVWPRNFTTVECKTDLDKILYFCNPSVDEFFNFEISLFPGFKQSYCDIKDLAWPGIKSYNDFLNLPSWIQQEAVDTLPHASEIISYVRAPQQLKKYIWIYTDFDSQNELAFCKKAYFYNQSPDREKITDFTSYIGTWQNTIVDRLSVDFLNKTDIQIKLQDLVNTPEILIKHGLVTNINSSQIIFLENWKKLHPSELLKKIGIV